jgi:hypothetical protein
MTAWIADVPIVLGLIVMTLGVNGIAQTAYHQREPMRTAGAVDERGTMPPPTAAPLQRHHREGQPGS